MKYFVLSDEKSLADLATNAFRFSGRKSKSKVDAAAKALLDLNPHLARIGSLPPGTPILVPELAEAAPSERTVAVKTPSKSSEAGKRLGAAFRLLDSARAAADERRRSVAEAFDSPELRRLAEEDGQLAAKLGRIKTAANEADAAERKRIDRQRDALEALRKRAADLFIKFGV
jgi:hypothetical protein